MQKFLEAIRNDKNLGKRTCSWINMAWDDKELIEQFTESGIRTSDEALKWAYDWERLQRDNGTNCSSGEENCPLISQYQESQAWENPYPEDTIRRR